MNDLCNTFDTKTLNIYIYIYWLSLKAASKNGYYCPNNQKYIRKFSKRHTIHLLKCKIQWHISVFRIFLVELITFFRLFLTFLGKSKLKSRIYHFYCDRISIFYCFRMIYNIRKYKWNHPKMNKSSFCPKTLKRSKKVIAHAVKPKIT